MQKLSMQEKIVVIDDELAVLELCRIILESRGYEVRVASSGDEGLRLIESFKPALILLDYMMPGMDGMEVLRKVKTTYKDIYVVMFTGKGSEPVAVEVMKAGASDYILKPFNNKDLFDRIENVLHIRRIEMVNRRLKQEREELQHEIQLWNRELEFRVRKKTRELRQANREVIQAEKLVTVGQLAAGMAHEIRNPLNSIALTAQLLQSECDEETDQTALGYAQSILFEVERIDTILRKLLGASKHKSCGESGLVCLQSCIESALELFREQIKHQKVNLDLNLHPAPVYIMSMEGEVEQIFTNLISNALHEMPNSGTLSIDLEVEQGIALVHVGDTGSGIPEDNLVKIFDPFYTTKSAGTGFGLSVVLRVVKSCNGNIRVESEPGRGANFYMKFPLPHECAADMDMK
ncbi:MAG: response regulator [Desulfuromonadaceae bacterium]|nr:response regulator [Desulfuromonadaceae bacterium]